MAKKNKSFFLCFIKALLISPILFGSVLFTLYLFRTDLIHYGGKALGYKVSVGDIRPFFQEGSLGIHLETMIMEGQTGVVKSFQANELRLLLPLVSTTFLRDFQIKEISLKHPHLILAFPKEEEKTPEAKKKESPFDTEPILPLEIRKAIIEDGQVTINYFPDNGKTEEPSETEFPIKNIFLLASVIQSQTPKAGLRIKADNLSCSPIQVERKREETGCFLCC